MSGYYKKYLKYKSKYVDFKTTQTGGAKIINLNLSPENRNLVLDEIHFWGRQMMEHSLFLHLGIVDDKLKNRGLELYKDWEKYISFLFKRY